MTLGGETGDIFGGLLGPLISLFSDKWTGLMLWWKPMNRADVDTLKELIAAGKLSRSSIGAIRSARSSRHSSSSRTAEPRARSSSTSTARRRSGSCGSDRRPAIDAR